MNTTRAASHRRQCHLKARQVAGLLCALPMILSAGHAMASGGAEGYKFSILGSLEGERSIGLGINDQGQVVGSSLTANWNSRAVEWKGRVVQDLGPGGSNNVAHGINTHGVIVGDVTPSGGDTTHAFRWHRGVTTDLGTLGGATSYARAVDRCGRIAGFSALPDGSVHAFVWADGVMSDLPTLGGDAGTAQAMNNVGQVGGGSRIAGNAGYHATVWNKGVPTDLGSLGGRKGRYSVVMGLNDAGVAVGEGQADAGNYHAMLWQGSGAIDLGTLGGKYSAAYGINNAGTIVGYSDSPKGKHGRHRRAVIWNGLTIIDLNTRLNGEFRKAGWVLQVAYAINDQGTITGRAFNRHHLGYFYAFRMTPKEVEDQQAFAAVTCDSGD